MRRSNPGGRPALQLLALALLFPCACQPDEDIWQDEYEPDCDYEDPEPESYECPSGVYECPEHLACLGGTCVEECSSAYQCYPLEGCRVSADHTCGTCLEDGDCRAGEGCVEGVCLPQDLPQWELVISEDDWTALETTNDETYVPCSLIADGVVYDQDVEVRFRGGSTRNLPERSFRIKFPEDAEHPGFQRKINLRAEYNDPSLMRTFLGFHTMSRWSTAPTPQVRYVEVWVRSDPAEKPYLDENYHGLMLEIERLGGKFLSDNNRDRDLALMEAKWVDPNGTLTPEDDYDEYYVQAAGLDDGLDEVEELVEEVLEPDWESFMESGWNTSGLAIEAIRTDSYLGYLSAAAALQCQDHVTNNFYFSRQTLGVEDPGWEFYAADLDLTFGCLWDSSAHNPICDSFRYDGWWLNGLFDHDDDIDLGEDEYWGNLATHAVLTHEQTYADYEALLCDNLDSYWWTRRMPSVIHALSVHLEDAIVRDWERWQDDKDAHFALDHVEAREEVLTFIEERRDYLRGSIGCP
jgi:hypothetical protein